ncbi:hypothetical protein L5849_07050 [Erythrobacter sp. SN021]|uniref:hypothetical protein n=1 Tax=Erythrobacter sp. SN021 TaxID=2912574 RepID=UPI001F3EB3DB|nr:hypothetical protein [Erythrobacter sp. SN021]MCF8882452.1 hypothetical protein [Erythrobacter sp. SN021]
MRQLHGAAALGVIGVMMAGSAAYAQTQSAYALCSQIEDDAARLACFDETYARETTLTATAVEKAEETRVEEFGLSGEQRRARREAESVAMPAPAPASGAEATQEGAALSSRVREVFTDDARREIILLENGQIWRAKSNRSLRGGIRAGWTAELSRSWSGGYRMKFNERSGFLSVERIK